VSDTGSSPRSAATSCPART